MVVTEIDKHSSLLRCTVKYGCKSFV